MLRRPRPARPVLARVTATVAALALAGTAVVLMGQARPGGLEATADRSASASTAPDHVHDRRSTARRVASSHARSPLAKGGTLTIVNNDTQRLLHNFTSTAIGPNGKPLFDVDLPPGAVHGRAGRRRSAAAPTSYYCKYHGTMTGTLVIDGPPDGTITTVPKFEQPLVQPKRLTGKHIRIVMRQGDGPDAPARSEDADVDLRRHLPRADDRPAGRARHQVTFVNHLPEEGTARSPSTSTAGTNRHGSTASPRRT